MTNTPQSSQPKLAVQMYSLRKLDAPLDEVLGEVAAAGYDGIETVGTQGVSADELKSMLDKHGLVVASSHTALADLESDMAGVVAFNQAVGNDTLIVPWLDPGDRSDAAEGWQDLGVRLGELAKAAQNSQMQLLYHNHDFEMRLIAGRPALEWLVEGAGEALGLELDLAWVVKGGQDPLELLQTFSGRVKRVHVKDIAPDGENTDEDGWADVGSGTLEWDTLLPAAQAAGATWYVVEHDNPKNPLESVRNSATFLKGR